MRVLVCGGRDFHNRDAVWDGLYGLVNDRGHLIRAVIEGGANGADRAARLWAEHCGIKHHTFMADWKAWGKAAGPMRNQAMIDIGRPDVVLAFPGGRGTADMVRRAKAAGVEVIEIPHPASNARLEQGTVV